MRFRQYTAFSEKEQNYAISANKRSETVPLRHLRKSDFVQEFYFSFNKIFESLDLSLVLYWMMPKKREKGTINLVHVYL